MAGALIMSNNESERKTAAFHFIVIDRNGPLAEFETWEDANHWSATHQLEGISIVRCEGRIRERSRAIASPNDLSTSAGAEAGNARGQDGRSAQEQSPPKTTGKVLVISEDVPTLLSMAQLVKVAGHAVAISRSSAEAVQTIETEKPGLIIVDVDGTAEHGWDGFHVVEWLRSHSPLQRAKYIIVSGGDPAKWMAPTPRVEAWAFVQKPIVKEVLLTQIRLAIGGPPEFERSGTPTRPPGR